MYSMPLIMLLCAFKSVIVLFVVLKLYKSSPDLTSPYANDAHVKGEMNYNLTFLRLTWLFEYT
jgi:hypothetical protein